jgi:hypothetical protein
MHESDLFFITKTSSLGAVVKGESVNDATGTTEAGREPRGERRGNGEREINEEELEGKKGTETEQHRQGLDSGGIERL